jgi:zinc protease
MPRFIRCLQDISDYSRRTRCPRFRFGRRFRLLLVHLTVVVLAGQAPQWSGTWASAGTATGPASSAKVSASRPATASPSGPASGLPAGPLPQGMRFLGQTQGVFAYQLANQLRVLLIPDQTKSSFLLQVVYAVGSAQESYGERGMAHLLEHLLFKGSPKHPELVKELKGRGAQYNATTFVDRTQYYESLPADDPKALSWALEMEADRMVNAFIAKKDLDSEMSVVRNEFENNENSGELATLLRTFSTAYLWHNNGNPTIGVRSDIENVKIERLQAFYQKYYQPDQATLILSGKIEPKDALKKIQASFGKLKKPTRIVEPIYTIEPPQEGERRVLVRKPGANRLWVAAYHIPASGDVDESALEVLAPILADVPTGVLYEELVKPGLALSVQTQVMMFKDPGLFLIGVEFPKEKDPGQIEKIIDERLARLGLEPDTIFTAARVSKHRERMLKQLELALHDSHALAQALVDSVSLGDYRIFFKQKQELAEVGPQDVARVFKHYFKKSNRTVGLFEPEEQPDLVKVRGRVDLGQRLAGFVAESSVEQGEDFDATPDAIEKRVKRIQLRPGLELALLSKKTRGRVVNVQGQFRMGTLESLKGKRTAAQMAGRLYQRAAKNLNEDQIKDLTTQARAQLLISGGPDTFHFALETIREKLPEALRLASRLLREAEFPEAEFEREKRAWISELQGIEKDPQGAAGLLLSRTLHPYPAGDVRASLTVDAKIAEIQALSREDVKAFYEQWVGADHAQIGIIGDFDQEEASQLLSSLLGDWHAPQKVERVPEQFFDGNGSTQTLTLLGREGAVVLGGLTLPMNEDHPDALALQIAVKALGGSGMHSRLAARLRQKEGLSYGVYAQLRLSAFDPEGMVALSATFAPKNRAQVERALKEVLNDVRVNGLTQKEINLEVDAMGRELKQALGNDGHLLSVLLRGLETGKKVTYLSDRLVKAQKLTAEDVTNAYRKWILPEKILWVWAGSFEAEKNATVTQ